MNPWRLATIVLGAVVITIVGILGGMMYFQNQADREIREIEVASKPIPAKYSRARSRPKPKPEDPFITRYKAAKAARVERFRNRFAPKYWNFWDTQYAIGYMIGLKAVGHEVFIAVDVEITQNDVGWYGLAFSDYSESDLKRDSVPPDFQVYIDVVKDASIYGRYDGERGGLDP